ncbi:MAG: exo-alpha-sialidase [Opitutales bacterium]|nr:exo-alpha-sialidase [Opitutales bacterium]
MNFRPLSALLPTAPRLGLLLLTFLWLAPVLPAALEDFLGPAFFHTTELWSGETGGRSIVAAFNGDVLVIKGGASSEYKRSTNGGLTWSTANASGDAARFSNAVLNETNGQIFVMNSANHRISRSTNNGVTWTSSVEFRPSPDRFGYRPSTFSSMQAGITLRYGAHAGRLVVPTRVQPGGNDLDRRGYHYSSAVYSDDGGQTWQTSHPFPVFGTGEAAIVELRDGRLLYNSREHMSIGNRYIATSYDGGVTWVDPYRDPVLPDGPRGTSYGNMGGLIRLPLDDYDILLYSNVDTDAGELDSRIGGTHTRTRENMTVWVSFDGGDTWPLKRSVFAGPAAYSNLGVGRKGTASEGHIFLNYDGGPDGRNTAAQIAVFNLTWLLDGADINDFID